jgi:hypothetical protein
MAKQSKFVTFGAFLKHAVNTTVSTSTTCYSNTKKGLKAAKTASVQAYNDTKQGYNSVK